MITIYGKDNCTFCEQAKALCKTKGVDYQYFQLDVDFSKPDFIEQMQRLYDVLPRSMPQIVDDGNYIGGFNELKKHLTQ